MANVVKVDPLKVNQTEELVHKGNRFKVHLSPYDLPSFISSTCDIGSDTCEIRVSYSQDDEKKTMPRKVYNALVTLGSESGRLYSIAFDGSSFQDVDREKLLETLQKVLRTLSEETDNWRQKAGYSLINEIVSQHAENLVRPWLRSMK